jgi:hypothetical protein
MNSKRPKVAASPSIGTKGNKHAQRETIAKRGKSGRTEHHRSDGKAEHSIKLDPRTITAFHEAGHALAYHTYHLPYDSVSIVPGDDGSMGRISVTSGVDLWDLRPHDRDEVIIAWLAGMAAESRYCGRTRWKHGSEDYVSAFDAVAKLQDHIKIAEIELHLRYLWQRAKVLMSMPGHWAAVEAVAGRLAAECELPSKVINQIIDSHMPVPILQSWRYEPSPAMSRSGSFLALGIRRTLRR